MAGNKNHAVVSVISGVTPNQAAQITKDIIKAKQKYAPHARGTTAAGLASNIGSLLQKGTKRIGG